MTFGAKLSLQGRFCARAQTGFCSTSSSQLPSHLPPSTYHLLPSTIHHPPSTFHLPPSSFHLSLPPFTSGLLPLLLLPTPTLISHFLSLSHISCHQSPISHLSSSISSPFSPSPLLPFSPFPSPFFLLLSPFSFLLPLSSLPFLISLLNKTIPPFHHCPFRP